MEINICGQTVAVERAPGVRQVDWRVADARLLGMDGIDEGLTDPVILALHPTFNLVRRITVFVVTQFGPHRMTRSFVDSAQGHFYWHVSDLTDPGYSTPERMLSYLLHDAHHCRQHLDGDRAQDVDSLVRREVEATDVQLAFARIASARDARFLKFLEDFRNDPEAIKRRLKTGVGFIEAILLGRPRYENHVIVF